MSGATVSPKVVDEQQDRATKKVKAHDHGECVAEDQQKVVSDEGKNQTFREALLKVPGLSDTDDAYMED